MKINKLRMKNFRSYESEVEFDFSTSNNKNIILIGGKNGAGKSTIFEAIKLCIYGPLAYRYQGFNSNYISKIKSNINNNSFKNDVVDAYISIDIALDENTEKNIYRLNRNWTFKDKKLNEEFSIYKNHSNEPLTDEEVNYFESHLKSIISPKIFEFFFFDGENLSDFFIGRNSNTHLKHSLLSLCNYDTLDVLKSNILSSSRISKNDNSKVEEAELKYSQLNSEFENLNNAIEETKDSIYSVDHEFENLNIQKSKLEQSFRSSGGLLSEELESLNSEMSSLESKRSVINQQIKDFCNEMLPLLILKDKLPGLKTQLEDESKYLVYSSIKDKLQPSFIENILSSKLNSNSLNNSEIALTISDSLIESIKPSSDVDSFTPIHSMSNDETGLVSSQINSVLDFNNDYISSLYSELKTIAKNIEKIRSKLNSSLDSDTLDKFMSEITITTSQISDAITRKSLLEHKLEELKLKLSTVEYEKEKAKKQYIELLQTNNVVDISVRLLDLLDELINDLTLSKLREVEKNFIDIFRKIIRKDKFIDSIKIDNDFNISLYIDKLYNSSDIVNMLDNIGYDEMYKKLGSVFFEDLHREYNTDDRSQLIKSLKRNTQSNLITLRTKVDVSNFSNGEKQIYVLCIYWALVKSSGINIPFIIDTPYARIDETHRANITTDYFSSISEQVIILSTNTEIDLESYKQIKPAINHAYLISYNDKERNTHKQNGYFYEV